MGARLSGSLPQKIEEATHRLGVVPEGHHEIQLSHTSLSSAPVCELSLIALLLAVIAKVDL